MTTSSHTITLVDSMVSNVRQRTAWHEFRATLKDVLYRLEKTPITPENCFSPDILDNITLLEGLGRTKSIDIPASTAQQNWFWHATLCSRAIFQAWETALEMRHAKSLCAACHTSKMSTQPTCVQLRRTYAFALQEAHAANISQRSSVAFVGSGPFPETAFSLASNIGCTVTCIDADAEAIKLSGKISESLGLKNLLKFEHATGEAMSYDRFSHVWVAVLVQEKDAVLRQIHRTAPTATVVVRSVDGLKKLLYAPLSAAALTGFTIEQKVIPKDARTIMHAFILKP